MKYPIPQVTVSVYFKIQEKHLELSRKNGFLNVRSIMFLLSTYVRVFRSRNFLFLYSLASFSFHKQYQLRNFNNDIILRSWILGAVTQCIQSESVKTRMKKIEPNSEVLYANWRLIDNGKKSDYGNRIYCVNYHTNSVGLLRNVFSRIRFGRSAEPPYPPMYRNFCTYIVCAIFII